MIYTIKKIKYILNKAKYYYYELRSLAVLEQFIIDNGLSSSEWYDIRRETRIYMRNNKINIFLFEECFEERYIQALNKRGKIMDGKTCTP